MITMSTLEHLLCLCAYETNTECCLFAKLLINTILIGVFLLTFWNINQFLAGIFLYTNSV